jgi:UDP-glucose 4-epimerase
MYQNAERIVVTGGAGFIGSHLADRLLADTRAEIVVLDNLSTGRLANLAQHRAEPRLHVIEGDVGDRKAVAAAVRGARVVFHLAARSGGASTDGEDAAEMFRANVAGTFNVLHAAIQHHVHQVVFASSHAVYGEPIALPVEESHPLMAVDCYGASKVAGEAYCRAFRRVFSLATVVLRLAHVYGPRDPGREIPLWLQQAMAGEDLQVHGGKQVMDFIWVGQAVEALVRAAAHDEALPPINVASGTGTRTADVARLIRRLVGGRGQIRLLPARTPEVMRFVASVDRMQQVLRLEPPLDPLAHLPSLLPAPVGARG